MLACATLTLPASAGVLNVEQKYQELNQWCWAGSCQAVLRFYGITPSQTNIAIYGTGGSNVWNYLWGQGTDPGDHIFRRGCDLIINNFGGVAGTGFTGTLTASQLQAEIDAFRPAFINWAWDSGGGHILVARGMVNSNVYLMDPWYGPSANDYAWVVKGGGHTWRWTIRITTPSTTTNGVPRWWLGNYNLTNGWQWINLANGDADGDGVPTWQEWVSDTDPTNPVSALRILSLKPEMGGIRIGWQGGTAAWQYLERSGGLGAVTPWAVVFSNIPPTAINTNFLDTAATNAPVFYRVKTAR